MANIYDIAAGIKTPEELRAVSLANRKASIQNRLLEQSAKYYDRTGGSEARQKDRELDIKEKEVGTQAGNLEARLRELKMKVDEDSRKKVDNFIEQMAIVHQAAQSGVSRDKLESLYNTILEANQIGDSFKDTPLESFDPEMVKSIALMSQVKDPKAPLNYIIPGQGGATPKGGAIDRNDLQGITNLIQQGAMFDPTGVSMQGVASEGLLNSARDINALKVQYVNMAAQFDDAYGLISNMRDIISQSNNAGAGAGTSGAIIRTVDSIAEQVRSFTKLVGQIASDVEEGRETPTGFIPTVLDPAINPEATDSEWQAYLRELQAGPFKEAVLASAALQFNIRSLAYASAKLEQMDDRLSNDDFRIQLERYNVGSIDQLQVALQQQEQRLKRKARFMQKLMDPDGELAKATGVNFEAGAGGAQPQASTPTAPNGRRVVGEPRVITLSDGTRVTITRTE